MKRMKLIVGCILIALFAVGASGCLTTRGKNYHSDPAKVVPGPDKQKKTPHPYK
jgi:hypothetical protein